MNFSFKKSVNYLLIASILSGILTPTLRAMDKSIDFPPPFRLSVGLSQQSTRDRQQTGDSERWPAAIELSAITSPSSSDFTRNPLDGVRVELQSPSSLSLDGASSPSGGTLISPTSRTELLRSHQSHSSQTVVDRQEGEGAENFTPIPPALRDFAESLRYQKLGERPSLTRKQALGAALAIGLFAYTTLAEVTYLRTGLLPTEQRFWDLFTDNQANRYLYYLNQISYQAIGWMIPSIILIAGQQGADIAEPLGYNRAATVSYPKLRKLGNAVSGIIAGLGSLVPVSLLYQGMQADYASGNITDLHEYNRKVYTQMVLLAGFRSILTYRSLVPLTETMINRSTQWVPSETVKKYTCFKGNYSVGRI